MKSHTHADIWLLTNMYEQCHTDRHETNRGKVSICSLMLCS